MKKKTVRNLIRVAAIMLAAVAGLTVTAFADADVVTNGTKMIKDVSTAIVAASTAAATIGVGTGAFMRKFSMGKPDKIETGGKIIKYSITGWAVLNGLTLIFNFIKGYLS